MDTDHQIRHLLGQIQLVKRHQHGHMLLSYHFLQDREQFQLVTDIQKRGRLIQHNDLRFLADGPGQKDPLPLTIADC